MRHRLFLRLALLIFATQTSTAGLAGALLLAMEESQLTAAATRAS